MTRDWGEGAPCCGLSPRQAEWGDGEETAVTSPRPRSRWARRLVLGGMEESAGSEGHEDDAPNRERGANQDGEVWPFLEKDDAYGEGEEGRRGGVDRCARRSGK